MYDTHAAPDADGLFAQASEQAGYFTSAQARAHGYSWTMLSHHTATGRFIRLRRGLYRLRDYPSSPHEEVMAAWLAAGKENAVVSHESALDLLDLSDVIPDCVHLTVPRSRRGLVAPAGVVLHTTIQAPVPQDTMTWDGVRLTTPLRSILDAAEYGTSPEQIVMAITQAVERGQIFPDALRSRARGYGARVERLVAIALDRAR
jgi:predicted transcriptional regulator of viral defense system